MSHLTIMERARVLGLAAVRARRTGVARVLGSPLLRWRYGAPIAEAFEMLPQELRPADPSFLDEIARGSFGLAGVPVRLAGTSPFEIAAPVSAWARSLHGFDWLRHLRAAGTEAAANRARSLAAAWISQGVDRHEEARRPDVAARRLISWIANADLLFDGADQATFDRTARSLGEQLIAQSSAWTSAPDGYPRLLALLGVVYGDLCIIGHKRHLKKSEARLAAEISRQILADGGHVSRNPQVPLELMLDLLPLRQCYVTAKRNLPAAIDEAMTRMMRQLRHMQLGDGTLARFNGIGAPAMAELSIVLSYDTSGAAPLGGPSETGYARLESGGLVLIADVGEPPPVEHSGRAQAGALSFELSAGRSAIFTNCGMPGAAAHQHETAARATASHSTLCLGDTSSARLVADARLERLAGGTPLAALGAAGGTIEYGRDGEHGPDGPTLTGTHDGYVPAYGLRHSRRLTLAADGSRLEGVDGIAGASSGVRLARDVPFAIHFHMPPSLRCKADADGAALLTTADGQSWRFSAKGAELSLEPSLHFADQSGPAKSRQIVLRGACWGETEVLWRLERTPKAA